MFNVLTLKTVTEHKLQLSVQLSVIYLKIAVTKGNKEHPFFYCTTTTTKNKNRWAIDNQLCVVFIRFWFTEIVICPTTRIAQPSILLAIKESRVFQVSNKWMVLLISREQNKKKMKYNEGINFVFSSDAAVLYDSGQIQNPSYVLLFLLIKTTHFTVRKFYLLERTKWSLSTYIWTHYFLVAMVYI